MFPYVLCAASLSLGGFVMQGMGAQWQESRQPGRTARAGYRTPASVLELLDVVSWWGWIRGWDGSEACHRHILLDAYNYRLIFIYLLYLV